MLGAGNDQMRAGAQMIGELLDRRRRNDAVVTGGQHQDRLADPRRIMHRAEGVHRAECAVRPGHGWGCDAQRRILLEDRRVARIADGIAGHGITDERHHPDQFVAAAGDVVGPLSREAQSSANKARAGNEVRCPGRSIIGAVITMRSNQRLPA